MTDEASEEDLFAGGESGGSYTRSARQGEVERTILRRQGTVWLRLAEILIDAGINIRKGDIGWDTRSMPKSTAVTRLPCWWRSRPLFRLERYMQASDSFTSIPG